MVTKVLPDAGYEIETVEDIDEAIRLVNADDARVIFERDGEPVAAVISLESLRLLLRLEDEELDRIDLEEIRRAEADRAQQERIPWEQVKSELGL